MGAFGTSGQRCTATSRIIVHEDVKEKLEKKLVARIGELSLGDGADESVKVGPVINRSSLEKIHEYVKIGQDEGAKLLAGGNIVTDNGLGNGNFYAPTIFKKM